MRLAPPPLSVLLILVLWKQARPVAAAATDPRTDEALYRDYAAGDNRAFRVLLDRHGDAVYRFLTRQLGDPDTAADVTQEVFLKVIATAGEFRGDATFRTFLFQVARNAAVDAARSRSRRPDATPLREELAGSAADDDGRAFSGELCRALEAGLERLPPEQREAFLLREVEDLTFPEIAAVQGVGAETARGRVLYAMKSLRRSLDGFGGLP